MEEKTNNFTNNIYEEEPGFDNLHYVCFIIEKTARLLHQPNKYVVNNIAKEYWNFMIYNYQYICHEPTDQTAHDLIKYNNLVTGSHYVENVDKRYCDHIPTISHMGRVYARLIMNTRDESESFVDGIYRVYNNDFICGLLDDYVTNTSYDSPMEQVRLYNMGHC